MAYCGVFCCLASAQLLPDEKGGIIDALFVGGLSAKDLDFDKKPLGDPYRLPLVIKALDHPLVGADEILGLHEFAKTASLSAVLDRAGQLLIPGDFSEPEIEPTPISQVASLPVSLRQPVLTLVNWIRKTNADIKTALGTISLSEKRLLIENLPRLADAKLQVSFAKGDPLARDQILKLLDKVDWPRIVKSGDKLAAEVERVVPLLKQADPYNGPTIRTKIDDIPVVIAGVGDDIHDETDALLTIDLGGHNTYRGRHGAGIGYASVLIDLGDGPQAEVGDANLGCGILGVGIAKFTGGNGQFHTGACSLGCGIAGVGAFAKEGGDDTYQCTDLGEGFGLAGLGVLIDNSGDDIYRAGSFSQGCGAMSGVGWLIDRKGDDCYTGKAGCQGAGIGTPTESGGIGLLTNLSGDDVYIADTKSQAFACCCSIGSVADLGGDDRFIAQDQSLCFSDSSGLSLMIHSGQRASFSSPAGSIGEAESSSVSLLVDRSEESIYASSRIGSSVDNSMSIIVGDLSGTSFFDAGNMVRSPGGSLSLLVSTAGCPVLPGGILQGQLDISSGPHIVLNRWAAGQATVTPSTQPLPNDSEMRTLSRTLAKGEGRERLIALGAPGVEWLLKHEPPIDSPKFVGLLVSSILMIGDSAREVLALHALRMPDEEANAFLNIARSTRCRQIAPILPNWLRKESAQETAIRAAGELGGEECVGDLLPLVASRDKRIALLAMEAVASIGSAAGCSTAEIMLTNPSPGMRSAAIRLLAKQPDAALRIGKGLVEALDESTVRLGLNVLGAAGSNECVREAAKYLKSGNSAIRLSAAIAVAGRCPAEFSDDFEGLRTDPSPFVRMALRRLRAN